MACTGTTLSGLGQDCKGSIGGITKVYIGLKENFSWDEDTQKLTAKSGATDAKLHRFYVRQQSSSMTSELTIDDANGIEYWSNTLSLVFARQSVEKRTQLTALTAGAPELIVVAYDANGVKYVLGTNNPVTRSAAAAQTGTAQGDANNYTISLVEATDILPLIDTYDSSSKDYTMVSNDLLDDGVSAE